MFWTSDAGEQCTIVRLLNPPRHVMLRGSPPEWIHIPLPVLTLRLVLLQLVLDPELMSLFVLMLYAPHFDKPQGILSDYSGCAFYYILLYVCTKPLLFTSCLGFYGVGFIPSFYIHYLSVSMRISFIPSFVGWREIWLDSR